MKKDLIELIFILDRSGSMSGLEKDTIGGFNSLIEKQKKERGESTITTVLFNENMEIIHDHINIQNINKLTEKDYYVSGCTALLDAIGLTINHINHIHDNLEEEKKPEKTLFIITTDGLENSSHEFTYGKIKKLIDDCKENLKYDFIFLGANIDSEEEATKLGIDIGQAVSFNNDTLGVDLNYSALNDAIKGYRKEKTLCTSWRKSIDSDYKNRRK